MRKRESMRGNITGGEQLIGKERRGGGGGGGWDRCTHWVSSPWSTDRWKCTRPSGQLHTCQPFYISNTCMYFSAGVTGVYVCAYLDVDVRGLFLHCPISHASLLSLCAFESVYAWISTASDPCAKRQLSPQSWARTPFIFTCLLSPHAIDR